MAPPPPGQSYSHTTYRVFSLIVLFRYENKSRAIAKKPLAAAQKSIYLRLCLKQRYDVLLRKPKLKHETRI